MILFRRVGLAAFMVYTLVLLTATHWPALEIRSPVARSDLYIHSAAFGVWTVLLGLSGLLGRSLWKLAVAGVLFAIFDETTQPLFNRTYDTLDLLADWGGVAGGCGAVAVIRPWLERRFAGRAGHAGRAGRGA